MSLEYDFNKCVGLLKNIENIREVNVVNNNIIDVHHETGFIRIRGFYSIEIKDGWVTIVTQLISWTYWIDSGMTHVTMYEDDNDESE